MLRLKTSISDAEEMVIVIEPETPRSSRKPKPVNQEFQPVEYPRPSVADTKAISVQLYKAGNFVATTHAAYQQAVSNLSISATQAKVKKVPLMINDVLGELGPRPKGMSDAEHRGLTAAKLKSRSYRTAIQKARILRSIQHSIISKNHWQERQAVKFKINPQLLIEIDNDKVAVKGGLGKR